MKHVSALRVIVLGGGLAGITAALDCAEAGARVTLLEVRPRLGGAAYSFQRDGLWLDNGQHVFLRCCTAYRELLARLGSERLVLIQPRLEIPVLSPGAKQSVLRRNALPAPLHLASALARYPHLTVRERVRAGRVALQLARLDPNEARERERVAGLSHGGSATEHGERSHDDALPEQGGPEAGTLGEWLAEHGQDARAVANLWDLITLPTLNLPAARGSLVLGAFVLQTGLLKHNDAGDIGFHMRPLSETLGDPAERVLGENGVEILLGMRAERVEKTRDGMRVHAGGLELDGDAVISAVPHERAAPLLEPLLGGETARWSGLGSSPIVNVHVVYDRRVCDVPFAAGVGTPVQYVFDRSAAAGLRRSGTPSGAHPKGHTLKGTGKQAGSEGQYLAVSLSGAEEEMQLSSERLRERYLSALRELFPRARDAVVRGVHVSREHAATINARPGTQALRPGARTSVHGLVLAGAWTDTGWPATLEGAVLSGHSAAREVLST